MSDVMGIQTDYLSSTVRSQCRAAKDTLIGRSVNAMTNLGRFRSKSKCPSFFSKISNRFHADAFLSVPESGEVYNHQTKLILLGMWNFARREIRRIGSTCRLELNSCCSDQLECPWPDAAKEAVVNAA